MRFLLLFSFCLLFFSVQAQQTTSHEVYFSSGESTISIQEQARLRLFLDSLPSKKQFILQGHTDDIGSETDNLALSQARVTQIQQWLADYDIKPETITQDAYGEQNPQATNEEESGRQKNRRVRIMVTFEPEDSSRIGQLFRMLDKGYQTFYINPTRDTVISGAQGSRFFIPSGVFAGAGPCKKSAIAIQLKEIYQKSGMIMQNLSTTSNGRILETSGMYELKANCNGRNLSLRKGKFITTMIPTRDPSLDFQVFNGLRDPHDSIINWVADNQNSLAQIDVFTLACCCSLQLEECNFFFCKIKRFFGRLIGRTVENQELQAAECDNLKALLAGYGIKLESKEAIGLIFEQYGVDNLNALLVELEREKLEKTSARLEEGRASGEDIDYYISRQTTLNWINIDKFLDINPDSIITQRTNLIANDQTRVFAVFKNRDVILSAEQYKKHLSFESVPEGEVVEFIALRFSKGTPYFARRNGKFGKRTISFDFKPISLTDLEKELESLNS
jgi:uncharacterized protein YegP (UPF0339 family)